jgi:hypothetical protein
MYLLNIARNPSNSAASSRWLVDSDYLSLRQVSLSYNLPKELISKLIDAAKLYVNGENLKLWAKKEWIRKLIIMELLKIDSHLQNYFIRNQFKLLK